MAADQALLRRGLLMLAASALVVAVLTVVCGAALHAVEQGEVEADGGAVTVEVGMWWAVGTLATVGLGDVYPRTRGGKLVAAVTMLGGMGLMSWTAAACLVLVRAVGPRAPTAGQAAALAERLGVELPPAPSRRRTFLHAARPVAWSAGMVLALLLLCAAGFFAAARGQRVHRGEELTFEHALWFAVAAVTTVGYGDIVPEGGQARAVAALSMLAGMLMVGFSAAAFSVAADAIAAPTATYEQLAALCPEPRVRPLPAPLPMPAPIQDGGEGRGATGSPLVVAGAPAEAAAMPLPCQTAAALSAAREWLRAEQGRFCNLHMSQVIEFRDLERNGKLTLRVFVKEAQAPLEFASLTVAERDMIAKELNNAVRESGVYTEPFFVRVVDQREGRRMHGAADE